MVKHPELTEIALTPFKSLLVTIQIFIGLALLGHGLITKGNALKRILILLLGGCVIFLRLPI